MSPTRLVEVNLHRQLTSILVIHLQWHPSKVQLFVQGVRQPLLAVHR